MSLKGLLNQIYVARSATSALVMRRYPSAAVGVQLTASGNTTGVYQYALLGANEATIVAAGGILSPAGTQVEFWLAGVALDTRLAVGVYVVKICEGAAGGPATRRAELQEEQATAVGGSPGMVLPIPLYYPVGVEISGDLANNDAGADDTANCSVLVLA